MRLESINIRNLRAFEDATVNFNDYTCLVGANGAGKSTVLCALNVFFRETENTATDVTKLEREDFFNKDVDRIIQINVTFSDLTVEAQNVFKDYYRNGKLIITAEAKFNQETQRADVRQFGQRLAMVAFKEFFGREGDGAKASELKEIYDRLCSKFPDLPKASSTEARRTALREYETARPDECELIPSEDQFYGVSKGSNRLAQFIQWVYVPAVKDALTEQVEGKDTALGRLLARTVRSRTNFADGIDALRSQVRQHYQEILDANQSALNDVSNTLRQRLSEWSHPEAKLQLQWQQDPDKSVRVEEPWAHVSVGEGSFDGKLSRLGHGLQRSYIIALLQELAAAGGAEGPKLILACEEPELYQHPPQARHLAMVLKTLSQGNAQVMVSTHSPYFVSGEAFEDVRVVHRSRNGTRASVKQAHFDTVAADLSAATEKPVARQKGILAKLHQALQPNIAEMFFTPKLILVEGKEDAAYIQTYLQLAGLWEEYRRGGCHIVPTDKKSEMLRPLAIAKRLDIQVFVLFDADGNAKEQLRDVHRRDNTALLRLCGFPDADPFPSTAFWSEDCVVWPSCFGTSVADDIGDHLWAEAREAANKEFDDAGGLNKNILHIASRLEYAWQKGARPDCLQRLSESIIAFAKR
jgi:predicted ATP-binding protein involved in virulence